MISVVTPAFDEERYLGPALASLNGAAACLRERGGAAAQLIVVDNDGADATAEVARGPGSAQGATQFCRRAFTSSDA